MKNNPDTMSKKCTKCGDTKSEYYTDKTVKDGLRAWCNDCIKKGVKEYRQTKTGLIVKIYAAQKSRSITKGRKPPTYTKQELKEWLFSQKKFHSLYNNWKENGYTREESPSVDRIDDGKGYSFENIQVMTWRENSKKGHDDMKNGKTINSHNPHRPVIQNSLQGKKITEYHSISEAGRQTGIFHSNIISCCRGIRLSTGGFKWKYKYER